MNESEDKSASRPPLALRVGITGARRLRADQRHRIAAQVREVLSLVKDQMDCLDCDPAVGSSYRYAPGTKQSPRLRLLSPLARGADRLAAHAALDLGYELHAVLPFAQAEYEKDFTGRDDPEEVPLTAEQDLADFRKLRNRATTYVALDGAPAPDNLAGHAYEVAGRFVVRHSDVMIAVWDGKASNGRGGTAEIVRYALGAEVPVWWIHATEANTPPAWLGDIQDLRDRQAPKATPEQALRKYLRKLIEVPKGERPRHHGLIGCLARRFRKGNEPPAEIYFGETPRASRYIWRAYSYVTRLASHGVKASHLPRRTGPEDAVLRYWYDLQWPAGDRAREYADRYRSSYVLGILLSTLALLLGGLGVALAVISAGHGRWACFGFVVTCLELLVLIAVLVLWVASVACEWHDRSIDYRILAELFRKQMTLAAVGWTLPFGSVAHLEDIGELVWVYWLFAAMQRAAPLPQGDMVSAEQHERGRRKVQALIAEQLEYHSVRMRRFWMANETFEALGYGAFFLLLACTMAKLVLECVPPKEHLILASGLLATVLPGVSAAFVGLRRYAEWKLLGDQSQHMITLLKQAGRRVRRLDLSRPSVSQDLGSETLDVARLMLQDLEGWGRLFRGKAMEP